MSAINRTNFTITIARNYVQLFVYCILICAFGISDTDCRTVHKSSRSNRFGDGVLIEYLYIQSNIKFRYAQTHILFQAVNRKSKSQNVRFDIEISKLSLTGRLSGGFISGAELWMDHKRYEASFHSRNTNNAANEIDIDTNAEDRSKLAGLVVRSKDSELRNFELIVKVPPGKRVNVTLTYEELTPIRIYQTHSRYEHKISVKPEKMSAVRKFYVVLNIEEQAKPIKTLLSIPKSFYPPEFNTSHPTTDKVTLRWTPKNADLLDLISKSVLGELTVLMDLALDSEDNEVLARDGYFTHFIATETWNSDDPPVHPMHTIFVLDISGSMAERRLQQLKDGMKTILNDLQNDDFLDIITFSDIIRGWDPMPPNKSPFPANDRHKISAQKFVEDLTASGSTNVYGALRAALQLVQKTQSPLYRSIIFFLTDGEATSGLTNRTEILRRLRELNKESKTPIFTLAFGRDADQSLCAQISNDHGGITRQIFDMRNASLLINGFYQDVSALLSNNISAKNYQQNIITDSMPSHDSFSVLFNERTSLAAAKPLNHQFDPNQVKAVIFDVGCYHYMTRQGRGQNDKLLDIDEMNKLLEACKKVPIENIHAGSIFQEKLWAFLETRDLSLKLNHHFMVKNFLDCPESSLPLQNLTRMALHYKFVTPCTTLALDTAEYSTFPLKL